MKPAKDNPFRAVRRAGVPICGIVMACSHCGQEYIVKNPPLGPYVCSKQVCKDAENKRLMETGEPNDIQRKFDETRATEAKRIAGGYVATVADREKDPYLSADSIVYEGQQTEIAKHELLEALMECLACLESDSDSEEQYAKEIAQARAAIEKARQR